MNPRALVMGSDGRLVRALADALDNAGMDVATAQSSDDLHKAARKFQPQIALIDLDGDDRLGDVCGAMKALRCPILALGGSKQRLTDGQWAAHLRKPFGRQELLAAVRRALSTATRDEAGAEPIQVGDLTLDPKTKTAKHGGQALPLTQKEFQLLCVLAKHVGMSVPREEAFQMVWGYDIEFASNSLEVTVYRLRKKLEDAGAVTEVQTIRGYGYRLVA